MAIDIDFFAADGQAVQEPTTITSAQKNIKKSAEPVSQDWKAKIKPVHVLILIGVLVMVWAVWPMLANIGAPNVIVRMTSEVPSTAMVTQDQQARGEKAEGYQKAISDERPTPQEKDKNLPEQVIFSIKTALAELQDQQRSVQASQQELKASLQLLSAHVKQLSDQKEVLTAQKPLSTTPSTIKPAPTKAAAAKPAASLPGLKVNTVYPGQAWIDAPQGKTYIVHVGDVLEGAQVLSIDEKARVVQTTHGAIR